MARQSENFLDRVMRYGGVQRRPQYAPRNNGGFVPRGGYGRQQEPQYRERPQYVQRQVQQPQPQPVQRQYTPEEIYAYRMEQAKREYAQRAYEAEMQRRAAYGVPQVGDGAAARPYEFLMGEADRLGASSGAMPAGGAQVPQGYAQQPEPEEPQLTEEEEAQLRIRLMYNDYMRESVERGAEPVSFEEFVQAIVARQQAQQAQAMPARQEPQGYPQQPEAQPAEVPQVASAEPTAPMPQGAPQA